MGSHREHSVRRLTSVLNRIKNREWTTAVRFYFSTLTRGDDYDPEEKNYTAVNLNPITLHLLVTDMSAEKAYYKQYGVAESGMKEILCDDRYKNYFTKANKIEIDDEEYQVYKSGTGKASIVKRAGGMIRVALSRKV